MFYDEQQVSPKPIKLFNRFKFKFIKLNSGYRQPLGEIGIVKSHLKI